MDGTKYNINGSATYYDSTQLPYNTPYTFRIRASNSVGKSLYVTTPSVTPYYSVTGLASNLPYDTTLYIYVGNGPTDTTNYLLHVAATGASGGNGSNQSIKITGYSGSSFSISKISNGGAGGRGGAIDISLSTIPGYTLLYCKIGSAGSNGTGNSGEYRWRSDTNSVNLEGSTVITGTAPIVGKDTQLIIEDDTIIAGGGRVGNDGTSEKKNIAVGYVPTSDNGVASITIFEGAPGASGIVTHPFSSAPNTVGVAPTVGPGTLLLTATSM